MPTFQSIPLHPSVASILLHSEQSGNPVDNDSRHHPSQKHQQQQQPPPPPPNFSTNQPPAAASVETPRALLTRDPQALVELFLQGKIQNEQRRAELLEQMEGIRHQVSMEMCRQTCTGRHILQQQQHNQSISKHQILEGASMCALQLRNLQKEKVSLTKTPYSLSTGCRALDELIAFPEEFEYASRTDQQSGRRPWNITATEEFGDETGTGAHERGGLPRGFVLALTGTTGKTQLCLQLAAQTCIQTGQRVQYCYSTAGHAGYSLAKRLKTLVDAPSKSVRNERMSRIDLVPIADSTQLMVVLAELEDQWIQQHPRQNENAKDVAMLILDSLPLMLTDKEESDYSMGYLMRWLKRMSRQYAVWIVVTGMVPTSAVPLDEADMELELFPGASSSLTNLRLVHHTAKLVTRKDQIALLNTNQFGMTTEG
jgi:KaiC/GvpD/RAD55 family RecA-like ATPase